MPPAPFSATLEHEEAVLRFPYDERLRQLLRAIPGRRWDPVGRVWCLPLEPDQAEALARLLAGVPGTPDVSDALARAIERRRARRPRDQCLVDLARPDEDWWLSFATDVAPEAVAALLEHPGAYNVPAIGRALVPLDDSSAELVKTLLERTDSVRVSVAARQALTARSESEREGPARERRAQDAPSQGYDVEFRRDRRGEHWLLISAERAPLARVLASRAGLRALEGPGATVGLAAVEHDAQALLELLGHIEDASVDPRVSAWLERATTWRGNIDVGGPPSRPPRARRPCSCCWASANACRRPFASRRSPRRAGRRCR